MKPLILWDVISDQEEEELYEEAMEKLCKEHEKKRGEDGQ